MDLKPIKRVPGDEGARHLTDAEVRRKLNELIDLANGNLEEIVYLRGQVHSLSLQLAAARRR
jgi:hypothetical protein